VRGGMNTAMAVGLDVGGGGGGAWGGVAAPWRPAGTLLAHLAEHHRAVNRLASGGGVGVRGGGGGSSSFFVSASSDGTAKVWDCRRLERDLSFRSRLTYAEQGEGWEGVSSSAMRAPHGGCGQVH
jgi:phosphoinositide-3-kinase regulatory subunit 4